MVDCVKHESFIYRTNDLSIQLLIHSQFTVLLLYIVVSLFKEKAELIDTQMLTKWQGVEIAVTTEMFDVRRKATKMQLKISLIDCVVHGASHNNMLMSNTGTRLQTQPIVHQTCRPRKTTVLLPFFKSSKTAITWDTELSAFMIYAKFFLIHNQQPSYMKAIDYG